MKVELNLIGNVERNTDSTIEENMFEIADKAQEVLIKHGVFVDIDREEVTVERIDIELDSDTEEEVDEE